MLLAGLTFGAGCASFQTPWLLDGNPRADSRSPERLVIHRDAALPADETAEQPLLAELKSLGEVMQQRLDLPDSQQPIHVFLFATPESYRRFLHQRFPAFPDRRAFFVESDGQLLVGAAWSERIAEDLRHEVAHGYLHAAVGHVPLWLDEGLAEYFETPPEAEGFHRPHLTLLREEHRQGRWRPDLARLERLTAAEEMTQTYYAESWAWVHWCLHVDEEHRRLLQAALNANASAGVGESAGSTGGSPPTSFAARLSSLAADGDPSLESQLLRHLERLNASGENN